MKLKTAIDNEEAQEFILLAYMEKTGIYKKLREILYDIYYGMKFPNPLPKICNKIELFSRKYAESSLSKQTVERS